LKPYNAEIQTLHVVIYLAELADGKTYNNIKVMKSTLEGYMKAMASYTQLPENAGRDIRREPEADQALYQWKEHPMIKSIYQQTTRWLGKTNWKYPLIRRMVTYIRNLGKPNTKRTSTKHSQIG